MRCSSPRTVGFLADGKTISWSSKRYSREYPSFQLPCGKCLACRLEYAREWAVRCVHEARMHPENSFITLTYSDEHLVSKKLVYEDFQKFAKRLRKKIFQDFCLENRIEDWKALEPSVRKEFYERFRISIFVTGEYGESRKRPHWHCIIFNWRPSDCEYKYTSDRGDRVYRSDSLDRLWGKGMCEVGSVTFESAGYVARYSAKKLVHGDDGHEWEPISKKSSKQAIGKTFLEKYWRDVFSYGRIVLANGAETAIPRYYEKWLKENRFDDWLRYMEKVKAEKSARAEEKARLEKEEYIRENEKRKYSEGNAITRAEMEKKVQASKFAILQNKLKGDF